MTGHNSLNSGRSQLLNGPAEILSHQSAHARVPQGTQMSRVGKIGPKGVAAPVGLKHSKGVYIHAAMYLGC